MLKQIMLFFSTFALSAMAAIGLAIVSVSAIAQGTFSLAGCALFVACGTLVLVLHSR